MRLQDREQVHVETAADLRAWLEANHESSPGAWIVTWRSRTGRRMVSYEEVIGEALCYGWVDGQGKVLDDERAMLLLAPRRPRSGWARTNKERVERLIASGRMRPAGLRAIETAKANGSWSLLDQSEAMLVPDDLVEALAAVPGGAATWDAYPPSTRKTAIAWVTTAKRPETRERRVAELARIAAEGRRPFV